MCVRDVVKYQQSGEGGIPINYMIIYTAYTSVVPVLLALVVIFLICPPFMAICFYISFSSLTLLTVGISAMVWEVCLKMLGYVYVLQTFCRGFFCVWDSCDVNRVMAPSSCSTLVRVQLWV